MSPPLDFFFVVECFFFEDDDFFIVLVSLELPDVPCFAEFICELLLVVVLVSFLSAQEARSATPARQTMQDTIDFFIGVRRTNSHSSSPHVRARRISPAALFTEPVIRPAAERCCGSKSS